MQKPKIISFIGPESTGKTSLAEGLGFYYNTPYLEEYARIYLESKKENSYTLREVLLMQEKQIKSEITYLAKDRAIYILDTDIITYKIWFLYKYRMSSHSAERYLKEQQSRLYLLCYPDLVWEQDPIREAPAQKERIKIFELYKALLVDLNLDFAIISGVNRDRLENCIDIITKL